jgi:hypothetical protein
MSFTTRLVYQGQTYENLPEQFKQSIQASSSTTPTNPLPIPTKVRAVKPDDQIVTMDFRDGKYRKTTLREYLLGKEFVGAARSTQG